MSGRYGPRGSLPGRAGSVCFEIEAQDLATWQRAANCLNISNGDIVSVQHVFAIYGGASAPPPQKVIRALNWASRLGCMVMVMVPNCGSFTKRLGVS